MSDTPRIGDVRPAPELIIGWEVPAPDWQAIHAAHRQADNLGVANAYRLEPGASVTSNTVFGLYDIDESIPIMPVPEVPSRTNGFGGRNRTERVGVVTVSSRAVVQALADFDSQTDAKVADARKATMRYQEVDDDGVVWNVWSFQGGASDEAIGGFVQRVLDEAERNRSVVAVETLRAQPYAKGYGTAPTPEEQQAALDRLAFDSKTRKSNRQSSW